MIAIRVALVAVALTVGTFLVWVAGFDVLWAIATVVAVGSVSVVVATLKLEEQDAWDPPARDTPRGIRLTVPVMEDALAACDRLARVSLAHPINALLNNERDDRLARGIIVRQMRALLVAELRAHGINPAQQNDDAVIALLGASALDVLQPNDDDPVTTAIIASCLDAVERLATKTVPQQTIPHQ